jgi:hypothetical protein
VTIGHWKTRTVCAAIRYQLRYSGVEYDLQEFEPIDADKYGVSSYKKDVWRRDVFSLKKQQMYEDGFHFPNLPFLVDGDFRLTESIAIH